MQNSNSLNGGAPSGQAAPQARKLVIASGVTFAAVLIWAIVVQVKYSDLRSDSARTIEAHVKTILLQNQQVEALDSLATRVDTFNRDFGATVGLLQVNESLAGNIEQMMQKTHLPDDAKKTLTEFERSIGAIREMGLKVKEYEHYLGSPAAVRSGDSHIVLARRYLVDEAKLSPQEAEAVLQRTALAWEIEPGNKVFNLYHDGLLLSTVTQGTAKSTPLFVQWSRRRVMTARLLELEGKVRALEAKLNPTAAAAPVPPATTPATALAPGASAIFAPPGASAAPAAATTGSASSASKLSP